MDTTIRALARPFCFALLFTTVASGQNPAPTVAASPAKTQTSLVDAGTLLSTEDVAKVQGCAITKAETSAGKSGQYGLTQCYYVSAEPDKSVSVALMQTDPENAAHHKAKELWHQTFDRYAKPDDDEEEKREAAKKPKATPKAQGREKEHEEEEREAAKKPKATPKAQGQEKEDDEKENPPRRIDSLGEAAYWTSNQMGGVLYVLKGEMFIRISVGGLDKPDTKLDKSKALAKIALARM